MIPDKEADGMEHLADCVLFRDLAPEALSSALRFFDAQERAYPRGSVLKSAEARLSAFGLVLSGLVRVSMTDIDGREMLLSLVGAGQTFGEALCYLSEDAPILIEAASDICILWLRCEGLRRAPQNDEEALLQQRFSAMLAKRTLKMNDRIQILSRPGIREKLMAFFTECARDAGSNVFDVPFNRAGMAAYLGVDQSALSRVLSQMQAQGILRRRKNHFELLGGGENLHSVANANDNA